ncbi:MAG: hypothetical protein KDB53_19150 [Planctomycetes bacterium]|nr:hypothetical protein [Planctomycetota bacterium]
MIPLWTLVDERGAMIETAASGPSPKTLARIEELLARPPATATRRVGRPASEDELRSRSGDGDDAASMELAARYAQRGKLVGALETIDGLIARRPRSRTGWMIRADLCLRLARKDEALAALRAGLALEPGDYIIRKQIWCLEHPEKFYEGAVDYGWQRARLAKELPK